MVDVKKAGEFVHANGTMWERALWDHLFDGGPLNRVYQTLLCYKNEDGGWGHGLEHDVKCPSSTPIALEFLLTILRDTGLPPGPILENTPQWVEKNLKPDGTLRNPANLTNYPCADWQKEGHSFLLSIAGNLNKYGLAPKPVLKAAHDWASLHLGLDAIAKNDWLFMAYRAFDYYMNIDSPDEIDSFRDAIIANIDACALMHEKRSEHHKLFTLFQFVSSPDSDIIPRLSDGLVNRVLDYLEKSQNDDGGWDDEHGLKYWQPYFSIVILLALKRFGRLYEDS